MVYLSLCFVQFAPILSCFVQYIILLTMKDAIRCGLVSSSGKYFNNPQFSHQIPWIDVISVSRRSFHFM